MPAARRRAGGRCALTSTSTGDLSRSSFTGSFVARSAIRGQRPLRDALRRSRKLCAQGARPLGGRGEPARRRVSVQRSETDFGRLGDRSWRPHVRDLRFGVGRHADMALNAVQGSSRSSVVRWTPTRKRVLCQLIALLATIRLRLELQRGAARVLDHVREEHRLPARCGPGR